jgi:HSP20 family molecular chaperone IbpA
MNMENRQHLDILTSVDVLNTLHGGVSEPQIFLNQLQHSREMRIKVPSVAPTSIQVEVNNNTLFIYYVMTIESDGQNIRLPYTIYNRALPYFIDIDKINSTVEDQELVVTLPFNALENGYHKKITTRED